jgi:hypothetical protein
MMTVYEQIRAAYPQPSRCTSGIWSYCVGGAASLWLVSQRPDHRQTGAYQAQGFPVVDELSAVLLALNPDLTTLQATVFSMYIMEHNDRGELEDAWLGLEAAIGEVVDATHSAS